MTGVVVLVLEGHSFDIKINNATENTDGSTSLQSRITSGSCTQDGETYCVGPSAVLYQQISGEVRTKIGCAALARRSKRRLYCDRGIPSRSAALVAVIFLSIYQYVDT